jgi:hypothetical protein
MKTIQRRSLFYEMVFGEVRTSAAQKQHEEAGKGRSLAELWES